MQQGKVTNLEWKQYSGMGHSTSPAEMADVKKWLKERLPAGGGGGAAGEL